MREKNISIFAEGFYSHTFKDWYSSKHGAKEEARYVFIEGNSLAERFRQAGRVSILELGFGLGINFLSVLDLFRSLQKGGLLGSLDCSQDREKTVSDKNGIEKLTYFAIEKFPVPNDFYQKAALAAGFESDAHLLSSLHILPVSGWQHFTLEGGQVSLHILIGDVGMIVSDLLLNGSKFHAYFADGFSPAKNPQMWSVQIFEMLREMALPGATLATYTVAGLVRRNLQKSGWEVQRVKGFSVKREMLKAYLGVNSGINKTTKKHFKKPSSQRSSQEPVIIGGGLSAAFLSESFSRRGIVPQVFESGMVACGASGNRFAALRPLFSAQVTLVSWLSHVGYNRLLSMHNFQKYFSCCSSIAKLKEKDFLRAQKYLVSYGLPKSFAYIEDLGGAYFLVYPGAGIVKINALVRDWLFSYAHVSDGCKIISIQKKNKNGVIYYEGFDEKGGLRFKSENIILANGYLFNDLLPHDKKIRTKNVRGEVLYYCKKNDAAKSPQESGLRSDEYTWMHWGGHGQVAGTYRFHSRDLEPSETEALLLDRFAKKIQKAAALDWERCGGRVSIRSSSVDRIPYAGKVDDGFFVFSCLGSRGLSYGAALSELLAAKILGGNLPFAPNLVQKLSPYRYYEKVKSGKKYI